MVEVAMPPVTIDRGDDLRSAELANLKGHYEADRGRVLILHGPRGVGKANLAAELVSYAKQRAHGVVFEAHIPAAAGGSFHAFAEIARQAMAFVEQLGSWETVVEPILDDLQVVLEAHGEPNGPRPLDHKLHFFEAVRRLLATVSERARLLIVIHDLERADSDTLELASYLAESLFDDPLLDPDANRPGLLLLLLRDDRTTAVRARDFLAEASDRRSIETLRLAGLDAEGLRRYVQSERVITKLLAASEGLPREIDELIDALPSNVEELFERRLEGLDTAARDTLRSLALFGEPAAARTLALVTGHDLKVVARALSEQRDARVLERRIHDGDLQFTFARRSNQEVTVRTTPKEEVARLHSGWAKALALEPGRQGIALLAYHQLRSTEPARGVPLAIKAAEAHAVAGAYDAGAQLLESALPHAKKELRPTILERLAELANLRGQPREALRRVEEWKAELPIIERGRALLRGAELQNLLGEHDAALATAASARTALADHPTAERIAVELAASEALYQQGALDQAQITGRTSLALSDAASDEVPIPTRLQIINLLGKISLARDEISEALELFDETLVLAQKSGLCREEARALVNLGLVHMRRGEAAAEAERYLLLGIEKAEASNDLSHLAFGNLNLGVLAHQRGDLGRAITCYRSCRSLFRQLGNRTQLGRVLFNLANLYLVVGDLRRARAYNDEALRIAKENRVERLVAIAVELDGVLLAEAGELGRAEERLREAVVLGRPFGTERAWRAMMELAAINLRMGEHIRADQLITEVQQALVGIERPNPRTAARSRLLRGAIDSALGRPAALPALLAAQAEIEKLGERLLVRDAELALGRHFAAQQKRETAHIHLMAAEKAQDAVAQTLPEDLQVIFEHARPQLEVKETLLGLLEPVSVEQAPPADGERLARSDRTDRAERTDPLSRLSSIPPAPAERRDEWSRRYGAIVGRSPRLHKIFHILDKVSASESTVLVTGESGTGKELVAEAIHRNSPRTRGPFVKLNCAALVESLLVSELFGHERGSFTGAHQRKVGRFEMAAGGTIFLDEIGDISAKTQVALLRVLQEREFERVGGGRPIKLEARIVCATNRNLLKMVREGTFREDLYYRLKGITVDMPSLRERPEDIAELANHFLALYALESTSPEKVLSATASVMLSRYGWPGNVRELENVIRSVALFADDGVIETEDFDEYKELFEDSPAFSDAREERAPAEPVARDLRPSQPPLARVDRPSDRPANPDDSREGASAEETLLAKIFQDGVALHELKRRIQDEAIAHALRKSQGNITRAAEMLGMKRPRLSQIINASDVLKALCQEVGR